MNNYNIWDFKFPRTYKERYNVEYRYTFFKKKQKQKSILLIIFLIFLGVLL